MNPIQNIFFLLPVIIVIIINLFSQFHTWTNKYEIGFLTFLFILKEHVSPIGISSHKYRSDETLDKTWMDH